jgi:hypothetical protein
MPTKKLSIADKLDLSVKRMLGGALSEIGGPEELGRQMARLGMEKIDGSENTAPINVRSASLTTIAKLLGVYGEDNPEDSDDISDEAVALQMAQLDQIKLRIADTGDGDV